MPTEPEIPAVLGIMAYVLVPTIFSILTVASALNSLFAQERHKKSAPRPKADAAEVFVGASSRPGQVRCRRLFEGGAPLLPRALQRRPVLHEASQDSLAGGRQEERRARQQAAGRSAHSEADREVRKHVGGSDRKADSRGLPACLNPRQNTRRSTKAEGPSDFTFSSAS